MSDSTVTPPPVDPVWWHKIVVDLLGPRFIIGLLVVFGLLSVLWWLANTEVPTGNQTLFAQVLGTLLGLAGALGVWLWSKSSNEAMKDKTIQDLVAKAPPTQTTTTTTTSAEP